MSNNASLAVTDKLPDLVRGERLLLDVSTQPPTSYAGKTCVCYVDSQDGLRVVVPALSGVVNDSSVTGVYHSADELKLTVVFSASFSASLVDGQEYVVGILVGETLLPPVGLSVVTMPGGVL